MPGIFISYRRADSDGWAGRLRDALRVRFGDLVFQDVDNIADGEIFSDVIDRALQACDVALVIIGPSWANAKDEQGRRRLDQEEDWVRTETAMVLNRKIRVIPVLVGGARLPRVDELPEDLRSLTKRQAREIRSTSWDSDVALLASHLDHIVGHHRKRVWLYAVPAVIVAALLGVFAGSRYFDSTAPSLPVADDAAALTADRKARPTEAAPVLPHVAEASKQSQPATPKEKPGESVSPAAPVQSRVAEASAGREPDPAPRPAEKRVEARKPAIASEVERAQVASADAATAKSARRRPTAESTRTPMAPPAERAAGSAGGPVGVTAGTIARVVPLSLPNRPASARELRIGDNWTYRLRDVAYSKSLATVTHEIRGGDASGIREIVRRSGSDGDGGGTQRRLSLDPRIFEQQVEQNATLFEFAPFMTAFEELRPGTRWDTIAAASGSEDWRFSGKVAGREQVRIPAGSFEAIKADIVGRREITFPTTRDAYYETTPSRLTYSIWYVPEIGRAVKYERRTYNRASRLLDHERYELVSYKLK